MILWLGFQFLHALNNVEYNWLWELAKLTIRMVTTEFWPALPEGMADYPPA